MDVTPTDITLRNLPLDEELIHAVRLRCNGAAARAHRSGGPWTVVLERLRGRKGPGLVHVRASVGSPPIVAEAEDPDPFLAVRNVFAMLTARLAAA